MMVELEEFLPEVITHAPNVPEPIAFRYIREAAQMVCQKSRIWREWDEMEITGDSDGDGVSTIQDARISEIENAWLTNTEGEFELKSVSPHWLDTNLPRWRIDFESTAGNPLYVTQIQPNQVMVVPKAIGTLKIRLVLAPSRDAFTLPSILLDQYSAEIGRGAAAKILMLPNTEFSNPSFGVDLRGDFESDLRMIERNARKTQLKAKNRTKPCFF